MQLITNFFDKIPLIIESRLEEICKWRAQRTQKDDGSYVTQGDLLVQEMLISLIRSELPQATLISEELADPNNPDPLEGIVIVIDPIDGTENFTSGLKEWGISISCYQDGAHIHSMLGCPELGIWLRTGQTIERHTSRIHALSSSLTREDLLSATQGYEYRVMGCCVYNMIHVIRGSFYSFENPKGACSWDILAGLNMAVEHGLEVHVSGKPYTGEYLLSNQKYKFKIKNVS